MFYHTHVYFSKRIDKNLDPLKIVGSFLPDFAVTGLITWQDLHRKKSTLDFFKYIKKNNPEYNSLLEGIKYHNILDYYSHIEYKGNAPGYAYAVITKDLIHLIEKEDNLDSKKAIDLSAHNFTEAGVEYNVLQDNPDLENFLKDTLSKINKEELACILAKYYKKEKKVMLQGLNDLFFMITDYDYKTLKGWLKFWIELHKYLKKEINPEFAKKGLELSFKTTRNTYKEFLEYVINSQDDLIKDAN